MQYFGMSVRKSESFAIMYSLNNYFHHHILQLMDMPSYCDDRKARNHKPIDLLLIRQDYIANILDSIHLWVYCTGVRLNSRGDGDGKDGVDIISEVDGASPQELMVLKV